MDAGVNLDGVLTAARFIADKLGKPLGTKVGQAGGSVRATGAATGPISKPPAPGRDARSLPGEIDTDRQ